MTRAEARIILLRVRSEERDGRDLEVAEALRMAAGDSELSQ